MNPTAERTQTAMTTNETKKNSALLMGVVTGALAVFFAVGCASYQNEAHAPGLLSDTMTTGEEQLPPSPPKSAGMIADTTRESKPWWPLVWTWSDERQTKAINK
jgi:hypothetical protein